MVILLVVLAAVAGGVFWWKLRRSRARTHADLTAIRVALVALADAHDGLLRTVQALPAPSPPPDVRPLEAAIRDLADTVNQYRNEWEDRHTAQHDRAGEWVDGLHVALRHLQARVLESVGQSRDSLGTQMEGQQSDLVTFREEVIRLANRPLPPAPLTPKTPDFPPALLAAAQERGVSPERLRDMMLEALGL